MNTKGILSIIQVIYTHLLIVLFRFCSCSNKNVIMIVVDDLGTYRKTVMRSFLPFTLTITWRQNDLKNGRINVAFTNFQ